MVVSLVYCSLPIVSATSRNCLTVTLRLAD
jgi:hypothetical protein